MARPEPLVCMRLGRHDKHHACHAGSALGCTAIAASNHPAMPARAVCECANVRVALLACCACRRLDPPSNYFRIRLVCTLLETCGQYFTKVRCA